MAPELKRVQGAPANLLHMARSYFPTRPPCGVWFLIHFIVSGKCNYLSIYLLVLYVKCCCSVCFYLYYLFTWSWNIFALTSVFPESGK